MSKFNKNLLVYSILLVVIASIGAIYLTKSSTHEPSDLILEPATQPTAEESAVPLDDLADAKPDTELMADQEKEASITSEANFDSSSFNPAFRDLTDLELQRTQPTVDDVFFSKGKPSRYRRHRLVAIDALQYKADLLVAWELGSTNDVVPTSSIPLFENSVLEFELTNWIETGTGFSGAVGHIAGQPPPLSSAWVHFDPYGGLKTTIRQTDGSYLIESLGQEQIYVIQSLEAMPEDIPFD